MEDVHGVNVLFLTADGEPVRDERGALDLIGDAGYHGAQWVAVPVARFGEDFFRLRTRVAGDIVQKFANYRLGLAVVGDISRYTQTGTALREFVDESNRGSQLWFVADADALRSRIAAGALGRGAARA
ncbi:DUF4180 domain-containing protein [Kitasatospora sp. NPDC054939]